MILVFPEPEMSPAKKILCITNRPLVAEMWPPLTAMPMLITPQWPLVVTRTMCQLPSYGDAVAGAANERSAKVVVTAKARSRLPIMGVLMVLVVVLVTSRGVLVVVTFKPGSLPEIY